MPLPSFLADLYFPWLFMAHSLSFLPGLLLHLLLSFNLGTLLSWRRLQALWFSRFWGKFGPRVRASAEARVVPLLQGRISQGSIVSEPVYPPVSGTVLEIGPGSGMWVSLFSEQYLSTATAAIKGNTARQRRPDSTIKRVYGVEPNPDVHAALRQSITDAGLEGTYEVVPMGIEDLATSGKVPKGSIDSVVTILCLCGIPEPQHNIREVYELLKPGGRWYAYEHVRCTHNIFMKGYQSKTIYAVRMRSSQPRFADPEGTQQGFLNVFWPHMLGGCRLTRSTGRWLREVGPWSKIDLEHPVDETWSAALPHVVGILTK